MEKIAIGTNLPNDLLVKTDRASMRFGLEARMPFLDHHLYEFVYASGEMHIRAQIARSKWGCFQLNS